MITKSKVSVAILYVSLLAFTLFAACILYINQDVLYTAHDRSEFLYGKPFIDTLMSRPFGLMQYVGAWLTQLFYYPALGAGVLVLLWTLIFLAGKKAFRLQGNASAMMLLPVSCLLTSIVDLGYWIYISPVRGYWFSQSAGYLIMLLLLWTARNTPRHWHLLWYLIAVCSYPVLGWFALLFVLCLAFIEKPTWRELVGILILFFTAHIWHTLLYSNMKADDVMFAGMPRFVTASDCSERPTVPFWMLGAASVLIPLVSRYLTKAFVPVACAVAGIALTCSLMFHDSNYIDEMRMMRYAEAEDWDEVINTFDGNPKPTTSMVMLKNVALMNSGELHDQSFKSGNISLPIYNPDSLHVSFLNIAAPMVYYNYGMVNEAIRLSYECAVQNGFSPFYMKMLSRCANATGEDNLKERFLTLLHHHPYYGGWQPAHVTENVYELQHCYQDEITGVENSDSYVVNTISLWYKSNSRLAAEQSLFYSMIRRDPHCFWPSLRSYIKSHIDEEFPTHAQEAYILFYDRAPEERKMKLPVSEDIYERYKQFWSTLGKLIKDGAKQAEIPEIMRGEWGDTYWYYNIFCTRTY